MENWLRGTLRESFERELTFWMIQGVSQLKR